VFAWHTTSAISPQSADAATGGPEGATGAQETKSADVSPMNLRFMIFSSAANVDAERHSLSSVQSIEQLALINPRQSKRAE